MRIFLLLIILCLEPLRGSAAAKVFYAKEEAIQVAFPDATSVEKKTFILTDAEVKRVEALARAKLDSKLVTFYIGKKDQRVIGYAVIDVHIVRTLPEAFMVVLSPEGRVVSTLILAFYEPLEYLPQDRWLKQFEQKTLGDGLIPGRDIAGLTGATLTARAVAQGVSKILALYQVLIAGR